MTMMLPPFALHRPTSLKDLEALIREFPEFDVLAGGSDLLPNYKCGLNVKDHVISLQGVEELSTVSESGIGATVTLHQLCHDEGAGSRWPALIEAAERVASPLLRRQATVGGNLHLDTRCHFFNQSYFWRDSLGYCLKADGDLCHVVPKIKDDDGKTIPNTKVCYATNSSDLAPVMIVLDAELEYLSPRGSRRVKARDLYCHDGIARMNREPDEIMIRVHLPKECEVLQSGYLKLRPREAWDFPVLGVAAAVKTDASGVLESLEICVNAVDTYPLRMEALTSQLVGTIPGRDDLAKLAEAVQGAVQPKLNVPMQPGYRKKMTGVFTRRLLGRLLGLG